MDRELSFSDEAEISRYLFYKDYNDITFFVEDKDKEYEYEAIFRRLFPEYRVVSIIAPGGKPKVIQAFYEFGESDSMNPEKQNFYILDGDFDRVVHESEMINNSHVIYLDYYNIENYLIDDKAILQFMQGKMACKMMEVREKLELNVWKNKIVTQAKDLFFLYCAIQISLPGVPNVSRNEYLFIDDKNGFARENAYKKYYTEVKNMNTEIDSVIQVVQEKYNLLYGEDFFPLICGKFLLSSLYSYLSCFAKNRFSKKELRWFLICEFDINKLSSVRERVISNLSFQKKY